MTRTICLVLIILTPLTITKNTITLQSPTLIVIFPSTTAVGKTALQLPKSLSCDIVSADSRQFFQELSIGTAKPNARIKRSKNTILLTTKSIVEEYNASDYEFEVLDFLKGYFQKSNCDIVEALACTSMLFAKGFDSEVPTADPKN